MTQGSLLDLAAELEQLAEKGADVKKDLEDNARELRELEKEMQASFSGPVQSLKENIYSVQSGAAQLEGQTTAVLDKANKTQEFLEREMPNIIKNVSLPCPAVRRHWPSWSSCWISLRPTFHGPRAG